MDMIKAVSNRLLELCKERNITVNRLANLSAVPPSTVKNIVYGLSKNPKIITIKMLCDGLEITLAKFFDTPSFDSSPPKNYIQKPETSNADSGSINTLTAVKYRILQLCEYNHVPIYKLEELTGVPTVTINNRLPLKTL